MNKFLHYILPTIFLILLSPVVQAQDTVTVAEEPPPEMADTAVYETTVSHNQFKEAGVATRIDVRTIPDQDLNKVKSDDDYWYVNLAPHREKKEPQTPKRDRSIFNTTWFNTFFWIVLIGGFLALLIWFLATSNISLFRKKVKSGTDENAEEAATENIFEMNFEKEIQKAIEASDFRLAVRLMYLRTLRDLSFKNLITYTHEKTNTDYLVQLAGSAYYRTFFRLTRNFDYAWYGHFPVSQESFSMIQNEFNSFKQQLA